MAGGELEVLSALDKAKTQWYHFTAIIVAGMGFFTDAYDLFCISTVTKLLGRIYYYDPASDKPGTLPANVAAAVNGVALCGTLAGQLFFGWLGDKLGRKRVYGLTLMIMIVTSIACGLSFGSTAKSVMSTLCIFRFWLGFGIGGDYPLSATIMSEYANKKTRGAFIAAVFAMQGFGILAEYANKKTRGTFIAAVFGMQGFGILAGFGIGGFYPLSTTSMSEYANKRTRGTFIATVLTMQGFGILVGGAVAIIVSAGFNNADPRPPFETGFALSTPPEADYVWRIIFMVGAVPAALTYYWRMKMPETARYTALVEGNAKQAAQDMAKVMQVEVAVDQGRVDRIVAHESYNLFSRGFLRRHGSHLVGTCTTWFLLDVAFYSSNLFQKDVYTAVGLLPKAAKMSALEEVFKISRAQVLVALFSTVPGYWFTVAFVDRVGRFAIQLMGFFMMTAFMFALSIPYDALRGTDCSTTESGLCGGQHLIFIVLFAFTFFFANFGPNTTTFIVPAEIFPARFRSTCHGISSASGKAGAIVGAFGFLYAAQSPTSPEKGYAPGIGTRKTLIILACTNALGFLFTFLVPETKGQSLEDITGENDDESTTTVG